MTDDTPQHDTNRHSLSLSGIGYLIGDAALFASGLVQRQLSAEHKRHASKMGPPLTMAASILWAGGGLTTSLFGNPTKDQQLEILAYKLRDFLEKDGVRITPSMCQHHLLQNNGLAAKFERFMHEFPSEVFNTGSVLGGSALLGAGIANRNTQEKIMGAFVIAGGLGGLFIKEDPQAQEKAQGKGLLAQGYAYLQERPLRFSSAMYATNNIFTVGRALKEFKDYRHVQGTKPYWFSFLGVAAYGLANAMLFISPRNQIEDKKFTPEDIAQLEQVAASIIGAQPKEVQQMLINDVAQFLHKEKAIAISPEHLAAQMEHRVAQVHVNRAEAAADRSWRTRQEAERRALESKEKSLI